MQRLNFGSLVCAICGRRRWLSSTSKCYKSAAAVVVNKLSDELRRGSRAALAQSITMVESRNSQKRYLGNLLLQKMLNAARENCEKHGPDKSLIFRVGISGAPGAGKSSFIEAFGMKLVDDLNKRLAVLCIDPSAHMSGGRLQSTSPMKHNFGGSILGDMTRMTELSRHPRAFIRQSPTHGALGGVARGTHDAVVLCEGAAYDLVFIETVGVGQSEVAVTDMVDMFVLLISPAQGDELQGFKRGIMELCDLIIVTKADGELNSKAKLAQAEYMSALKYLHPRSTNWTPKVLRASSLTGEGLDDVWSTMQEFRSKMLHSGELQLRRDRQLSMWMWRHVQDELLQRFVAQQNVAEMVTEYEVDIRRGALTPGMAAEQLMDTFLRKS